MRYERTEQDNRQPRRLRGVDARGYVFDEFASMEKVRLESERIKREHNARAMRRMQLERILVETPSLFLAKVFALIFGAGAAGWGVAKLVVWIQTFAA